MGQFPQFPSLLGPHVHLFHFGQLPGHQRPTSLEMMLRMVWETILTWSVSRLMDCLYSFRLQIIDDESMTMTMTMTMMMMMIIIIIIVVVVTIIMVCLFFIFIIIMLF